MNSILIVFLKNSIPGQVKTRLSATLGNEKTIQVYNALVSHTLSTIEDLPQDKIIFFSDYNDHELRMKDPRIMRNVQEGDNLGTRLLNAISSSFARHYQKVVVIGSDCPGLTKEILHDAFLRLSNCDVVFGPAYDGGYYLIGMNNPYACLFEDIPWSTSSVLETTLNRCVMNNISYYLLEPLHDIDEEKDLYAAGFLVN
jgi:rSAM/selenodomain-associated transferase 1